MLFVRMAFFPSGTAEHYDALAGALADAPVPEQRRAFLAGPVEDGWQVVQVWDDRASLDRWNAAHFLPVLDARGPFFPRSPVVRDFETHDHALPGD